MEYMTDLPKALLSAQVLGLDDTADALGEELAADQHEEYFLLTMALFAGSVLHRLGESARHDEIASFVAELTKDHSTTDSPVNTAHVEAMIRAVYGEEELLDGMSAADQYLTQLPTIRKVVTESLDMQKRLGDYLDAAETLAGRWMTEAE
jgi:hypothetical protein